MSIIVDSVSHRYKVDAPNTYVLKNINIEIGGSRTISLLGPNGAGKSTFLKIICGLLKPTSGVSTVDGICPLKSHHARRKISVALEGDKTFYKTMSGYENLKYFGSINHHIKMELKEKILSTSESLDITSFLYKKMNQMSRGQRQRVSLALCLLNNPQYLILDEPTLGLDPLEVERLSGYVRSLSKMNVTTVIASHDLDFVQQVSDDIFLLHKGTLQQVEERDKEHLLTTYKSMVG